MRTPVRGRFHCPHCNAARTSDYKHVQKMFVFLYVPVARRGAGREFVQCGFCHRAFSPSVLESEPPGLPSVVQDEAADRHHTELTGAPASTLLVWETEDE